MININTIIINKSRFNLYGFFIILSILLSLIFVYKNLKREKIEARIILLSFLLATPYIIIGGKFLTTLTSKGKYNFFSAGLSSYGGAIGLIIGILIYEKITGNKKIKEPYIISLPLMYGVAKLGCFFAGCCYGIKYSGPFNIRYPHLYAYTVFPVQLVETIVFVIIFIVLNYMYKRKKTDNIICYTIIISSISKFILDFLRFSHMNVFLSVNQIISLVFFVGGIIYLIKEKIKAE